MRLFELIKRKEVDHSLPYDSHTKPNLISWLSKRDELWRGPHEGRKLSLMLQGKKPAALIDDEDLEAFRPYIEDGTMTRSTINLRPDYPQNVITLSGEEWRVKRLEKLYSQVDEYFSAGKEKLWHARIGMLLGYSNNDIRKFLQIG